MKRLSIAAIILAALVPAPSQKADSPFSGRWDMTVTAGAERYPRSVQELDLLQAEQVAAPVTAVLAAILCQCAGPSTRFDCC